MGRTPEPLPFDNDDASDLLIFIQEWRTAVQRQLDRLDAGHGSDAYLLIVAAHHVYMACAAFAVHDPTGEVGRICRKFVTDHAEVPLLRNVIMHFDEYYRGQGRQAPGRRVWRCVYGREGADWILAFGPGDPWLCNVNDLGRKTIMLAAEVQRCNGPTASWLHQMML
jgi:hypothetical protein